MTSSPARRLDATDWLIIAALSGMWGCAFFFLAIQLTALPPFTIVLLRVAGAAALLLAWAAVTGLRLPGPRLWLGFVVLALLNNVIPFALYGFAQQRIASGLAGILNATTPLWGVVVAHLFTRDERATSAKVVGVALGFAGVTTMIGGGSAREPARRPAGGRSAATPWRRSRASRRPYATRWRRSGRGGSSTPA